MKDIRFYFNSTIKIYIYYNRLLFNTYNKENLLSVYTADHIKLKIGRKNMITLNIFINNKPEIVNFCNVFYTSKLKYNFLSIGTIKNANYLILAKKKKDNNL